MTEPDARPTPGIDVETLTLDRQIADALMRDIIAWRILPGTRIVEREIARRFETSHGPVREAFRHLARDGFVEIVPWRGARVLELDQHSIADALELWKSVFGTVCRLTAQRFDAADAPVLDAMQARYEAYVRTPSTTYDQMRLSWPIGTFISDRCGSPLAQEMLLRVARIARWNHRLLDHELITSQQPELGIQWAYRYRKAINAIIAGEPDEADRYAREFLGFTQLQIHRVLDALGPEELLPLAPPKL